MSDKAEWCAGIIAGFLFTLLVLMLAVLALNAVAVLGLVCEAILRCMGLYT